MTNDLTIKPTPHSLKAWIQVFRIFSYTAAIIPILLGAAMAMSSNVDNIRWWLLPLILPAGLLIQAGTNLVNEYYDLKKGVDRPDSHGSSRALVDQLLNPTHVLIAGLTCFALSAAIGIIFVSIHGWPILMLGVFGIIAGLCYTAAPVAYKYIGIGDPAVFFLMGPLMVIGSFFVLTATFNYSVLLVSIPVGFLVTGILSGNNLRDITHDKSADIETTASLLGHRAAKWEYSSLIIGAYFTTLIMICFGTLPYWSLITLLTLPIGIKNIKTALFSKPNCPTDVIALDVQTAQLHLLFGLLLIISVVLGALI